MSKPRNTQNFLRSVRLNPQLENKEQLQQIIDYWSQSTTDTITIDTIQRPPDLNEEVIPGSVDTKRELDVLAERGWSQGHPWPWGNMIPRAYTGGIRKDKPYRVNSLTFRQKVVGCSCDTLECIHKHGLGWHYFNDPFCCTPLPKAYGWSPCDICGHVYDSNWDDHRIFLYPDGLG
jgi:hypothetical protein